VSNHGCVSKSTCLAVAAKEGCERVDRLRNCYLVELFIASLPEDVLPAGSLGISFQMSCLLLRVQTQEGMRSKHVAIELNCEL